jgi:glyoxylase-like metal-dependent hydrolase (beta-lactamase superfamily II)
MTGWEIYCCRLGTRATLASRQISGDTGPRTSVYLLWVLRRGDEVVLVDTGVTEPEAAKRGITDLVAPKIALGRLGIDPDQVERVLVSHLHGDHFCAWDAYPRARFLVQHADLEFFSGPYARFPSLVRNASDMAGVMTLNYQGRIEVVSGDVPADSGLDLVRTGGHTPGSQAVVVETAAGPRVICGDVAGTYRTIALLEPSPLSTSRPEAVVAMDRLLGLVGGDAGHLYPSHDLQLFEHGTEIADGVFRMR